MKKTDLIELLKDIADDGEINETLLGSDEFKGLKDLSNITADDISSILTGEVGKAYMQSHDDSVRSHAVETYKNGKGKDAIEKARLEGIEEGKNGKKLTPEQIELKELKDKIAKMEAEKLQAEIIKANGQKLKDKGLDEGLAKYVKEDSDIEYFENIINAMADSKVKEKLGDSAYKPPVGGQQGENWTLEQAMNYMNAHPDADINSVMAKVK
ncbi:MAG: hypothetical protein ACI4WU_04800 [Bacilli bacterium]